MSEDPDNTSILIVDDLPEKVLVYRSILDELGQNLIVARSGEEALREVLRNEFAVILLDVQMPGMDGFETAAMIRRRKRSAHTPIIFITAFADEVRQAEGYAQGAVDYIPAPVVPEILRAKVRVFVDLFRMTQQVRRQAEERVVLAEERSRREAAEEANRRLAFLAEASKILAGSLDSEATAKAIAGLVVPTLADVAGVTLAGEAGRPWTTELAWADPARLEVRTQFLLAPDGPSDELRAAVDRALNTGRSEHLSNLDVPVPVPAGETAPHIRSAAVVPLRARDRTLGVLTLAFGASGRAYTPNDLATAEDLANRAAIALDNARLYREVQQADRQKNEFLSMLAHELRNPLAPIRNAVEVMKLRTDVPQEYEWARDVIDRQIRQLTRLVDDLLDVSRITRGKIDLRTEPLDLSAVAVQAVEASRPFVEFKGHKLDVSVPPDGLPVHGDPARLAQVFTNLLINAAKYTEEGGQIWLAVRRDGPEAVVSVKDTGVGIAADMLSAVFDLFIQVDHAIDRSQGGLGVGLTLVKRLVEMHGGSVAAHSDGPGQGSEFVVRLPALSAAPDRPIAAGKNGTVGRPARALKVLVVDDNLDAADTLASLLERDGHQVRQAHDGLKALEMAGAFRPDAVVLDLGLPGLDGYEVAKRIRAARDGFDPVLVAVSGYGRDEDRRRTRQAGFDHHLVKPADLGALRSALSASTGGR
jgi:signal transduction histidine kinase/DNA-binding response OmpR family regulator